MAEGVHPGSWVGDTVEEFKKLPPAGKIAVGVVVVGVAALGYYEYTQQKKAAPTGSTTGGSSSGLGIPSGASSGGSSSGSTTPTGSTSGGSSSTGSTSGGSTSGSKSGGSTSKPDEDAAQDAAKAKSSSKATTTKQSANKTSNHTVVHSNASYQAPKAPKVTSTQKKTTVTSKAPAPKAQVSHPTQTQNGALVVNGQTGPVAYPAVGTLGPITPQMITAIDKGQNYIGPNDR